MEEWRKMAIAEVEQLLQLLGDEDFSASDLSDRLQGLLEYIELAPPDPTYEDISE